MPTTGTTMGAYDAKSHFSALLERVENGEEITITRHGTPVARLVPIHKPASPEQRAEAIQRWRRQSGNITLGKLKLRDLIREGRA